MDAAQGIRYDLTRDVRQGKFREDLLARINLWTFRMPGLRQRPEDIEPNLDYELDQFARKTGRRETFNKEARNMFLAFSTSTSAVWQANFRDLNNAVTRMAKKKPNDADRLRKYLGGNIAGIFTELFFTHA